MFASLQKYLIMGGLAAVLLFGAWAYFNYTQTEIKKLTAEVAQTQVLLATQTAALESFRVEMNRQVIAHQESNRRLNEIRQENADFRKRLGGLDLGQSAQDSPQELEDTINAETQKLLNDFEAISRGR